MNEIVEELYNRLEADLQIEFDERAGIYEFDSKMSRELAEALSMVTLLKKHPTALLPSYMKEQKGERHE
jgi:hypothetical protein